MGVEMCRVRMCAQVVHGLVELVAIDARMAVYLVGAVQIRRESALDVVNLLVVEAVCIQRWADLPFTNLRSDMWVVIHTLILLQQRRAAEIFTASHSEDAATWGTLDKAEAQQIRLIDLLDCVRVLVERCRERADAGRPTAKGPG